MQKNYLYGASVLLAGEFGMEGMEVTDVVFRLSNFKDRVMLGVHGLFRRLVVEAEGWFKGHSWLLPIRIHSTVFSTLSLFSTTYFVKKTLSVEFYVRTVDT